jgi:hypothetical protein
VPAPFYERWRLDGFEAPGGLSNAHVLAATVVTFAAGLAVERARVAIARRVQPSARPAVILPALAATAAVSIAAIAVASLAFEMPHLATLEQSAPTLPEYVRRVVTSIVSTPRLSAPDHLIWGSFVGAFGWIDTLVPAAAVVALTALWSAAAVWLLLWITRRRDGRAVAWLLLAGAGLMLSVAAYAATSFAMHRNLHGRYLLGVYLVGIIVAASRPAFTTAAHASRRCTLVLLALIGSVHALSLWVILDRYFG